MKNRITICLGMVMIVLLIISVITYMGQDHTAPVVHVPEGEMTYIEGQNTDILLLGVTATDNKDDNLSAGVRIYDVAVLDNGTQALVTYAVYDKSNNLGKATKLVNYIAKQDVGNKKAENSSEDEKNDNTEVEKTTEDDKEEDTEEEKTTEKNSEDEKEAKEDEFEDPPLVSTGAPVIRLTTHEAHIDVGGYFYTMDYVEDAVDDIDSREYLFRNMYLDSTYDEYTAGVYELIYFCVDSDGNRSNDAILRLYVGQDEE